MIRLVVEASGSKMKAAAVREHLNYDQRPQVRAQKPKGTTPIGKLIKAKLKLPQAPLRTFSRRPQPMVATS